MDVKKRLIPKVRSIKIIITDTNRRQKFDHLIYKTYWNCDINSICDTWPGLVLSRRHPVIGVVHIMDLATISIFIPRS